MKSFSHTNWHRAEQKRGSDGQGDGEATWLGGDERQLMALTFRSTFQDDRDDIPIW